MASRTPALPGWLVVLVLGVLAGLWGVALLGAGGSGKHTPTPTAPASVPAARTQVAGGVAVLRHWDEARASAWASGEPARLRALYVPGSSAGRADAALLRRYRDRGLVVTGMRRQVLTVRVLAARPSHLRLRVTDRLVGAVAHALADRATTGRALPTSRAVTRDLALIRSVAGRWRVASVRVDRSAG